MVWSKLSQMKDDSKNTLSLENLSEEYVTSYDDVMQILIKVRDKWSFKAKTVENGICKFLSLVSLIFVCCRASLAEKLEQQP
jgi:hypothetical protein